MTAEFDFREWAGPVAIGPFSVTPVPVTHPVPAFGLRVSAGGATLGYTGDTGPCDAVDELARDADLFLAEASFLATVDNPPDLHLTGVDAGAAAARGDAKQLVLTHVPPWHDPEQALAEARTAYDGPIRLARAGATYDL
jgi:ribonuclease BN (tRNA processing enzyme)